jgi:hypothetical protein
MPGRALPAPNRRLALEQRASRVRFTLPGLDRIDRIVLE